MKQAKLFTYYVFEFKCSKVFRIKKPGLRPCLSYKHIENFSTQNSITIPQTSQDGPQNANFLRENPLDSPKN